MPENEFDKQVKKMMNDLELRPSEAVWTGVEKRIREKKRRRRAFIFLPLLACMMLLGYSGIHYFYSKSDIKRSGVNSRDETNKQADNKVSIPLKSENPAIKNQDGIKDAVVTKETAINKDAITSKVKVGKVSAFSKDPNNNKFISSNRKRQENFTTSELKVENKNISIPAYADKNEKPGNPSSDALNQVNENKIVANVDTNYKVNIDTNNIIIKNDSNLLKEVSSIKSANDSAVSKSPQLNNKLKWGFHLSTGISGTSSKLFQVNKNKSLYSNPIANSSSGGNTYGIPIPNSTKSGIGFRAGVLLEKTLSKRSSMDLGVQYSYYSDQIKVGSRTDSVIRIESYYSADLLVSSFYPNTSVNNYINRYHFIELPLIYHFQLINGKQNSLSWDLGISIGQLLSTNTLVFDTANRGVYYTDKRLFRKTNANLSTGFSITFNKHKSIQWVIGPQLQLGLSNLYKNYTDKKAYPFFAGIDLRLMLPKK